MMALETTSELDAITIVDADVENVKKTAKTTPRLAEGKVSSWILLSGGRATNGRDGKSTWDTTRKPTTPNVLQSPVP